jgi:hypothetical protein
LETDTMAQMHDVQGTNGTTACLKRCEDALENCVGSGVASNHCDEIYNGCVTGCENNVVTD